MTTTYASGFSRPPFMAELPDYALRDMLARYAGPALAAAVDEAMARGWEVV